MNYPNCVRSKLMEGRKDFNDLGGLMIYTDLKE